MNALRRTQIRAIVAKLEVLAAECAELAEQEQFAFDNLPEGLQQGEKGEAMEAAMDTLQEAENAVTEAAAILEELGNG